MATKQDLEPRESDCTSADGFVGLANAALSEPEDKDYAMPLLQRAGMHCQLPAQYVEECATAREFLNLADQVISELEDQFYARKLISKAEETLQDESFDFSKYQALITSIDKNLDDQKWVEQLYRDCIKHCRHFACVRQIA